MTEEPLDPSVEDDEPLEEYEPLPFEDVNRPDVEATPEEDADA